MGSEAMCVQWYRAAGARRAYVGWFFRTVLVVVFVTAVFYAPFSASVIPVAFVLLAIWSVVCAVRQKEKAARIRLLLLPCAIGMLIAILYMVAPRGGLLRSVESISLDNASLDDLVSSLEKVTGYPVGCKSWMHETGRGGIALNFQGGSVVALLEAIRQQTGYLVVARGAGSFYASLSGHHCVDKLFVADHVGAPERKEQGHGDSSSP